MNNEKRVLSLDAEVKILDENPYYQDWLKLKTIMMKGQAIEALKERKMKTIKVLIQQDRQQLAQMQQQQEYENEDLLGEPLEQDEVPKPPVRMAQRPPTNVRQAPPPPVQKPQRNFDYKQEEIGIDDEPEIEGLPDNDEIMED